MEMNKNKVLFSMLILYIPFGQLYVSFAKNPITLCLKHHGFPVPFITSVIRLTIQNKALKTNQNYNILRILL